MVVYIFLNGKVGGSNLGKLSDKTHSSQYSRCSMNYLGWIVLILVFIQKERPHCAVQAQHLSLLSLSAEK